MKKIKIVTSGKSYFDIDGYACCIAYAELINFLNGAGAAIPFTSAPFNYSVSKSVIDLGKKIETPKTFTPGPDAECIVMDVSDPRFFDPITEGKSIVEIFDHHVGFENYWQEKLGAKSKIEFMGCAATLIFEEWEKAKLVSQMSPETAKILTAAILDNTLNLIADVTSQRDITAQKMLCKIGKISEEWCEKFFIECQEEIERDLISAIRKDAKNDCNVPNLPQGIGQLTLWDAQKLLQKRDEIYKAMETVSSVWMINIISIKNKKSYFVCNNEEARNKLQKIFAVKFDNDIAILNKAMLRKEIIKQAKNTESFASSQDGFAK